WQKSSATVQPRHRYLEIRFVSGDDLFGEIQQLFCTESESRRWVLPEVINFFKSVCSATDENGFQFKLIQNGYIDDYMNTDNAWKEAKVWHIHYECREYLKKRFVDKRLNWRLLSDNWLRPHPLNNIDLSDSMAKLEGNIWLKYLKPVGILSNGQNIPPIMTVGKKAPIHRVVAYISSGHSDDIMRPNMSPQQPWRNVSADADTIDPMLGTAKTANASTSLSPT
ncbi:unnamed protein product, partial [Medioppia subpectinata]